MLRTGVSAKPALSSGTSNAMITCQHHNPCQTSIMYVATHDGLRESRGVRLSGISEAMHHHHHQFVRLDNILK